MRDSHRRSAGRREGIITAAHSIYFLTVRIAARTVHTSTPTSRRDTNLTEGFREFLVFDHPYRFVIHDRDAIFSSALDTTLKGFGIRVLKTPVRAPKANAFCERLIGTIRRECLDFLIPLGESHLKRILREWVGHYNRGRPHSSLGPGIPEPPPAKIPASVHRHKLPAGCRVKSKPVLGGLHHEYWLEREVA